MAKVRLGVRWVKMTALFTGWRLDSPYREAPTTTDCPCGQPYHNERRALSKHLHSKYITVRGASIITLIRVVGSPAPATIAASLPFGAKYCIGYKRGAKSLMRFLIILSAKESFISSSFFCADERSVLWKSCSS